jgi:hypothetical protein
MLPGDHLFLRSSGVSLADHVEVASADKWNRRHYQPILGPLRRLPRPILSRRWRRIVFISTTRNKFMNAVEINDLYDESPLEDQLWAALKRLEIRAERQLFVEAVGRCG